MQSVCPECQAANPVGNDFCGSCGASLEGAKLYQEATPEPEAPPESQQRMGCGKTLVVLLVIILCGVVAIMIFGGGGSRTSNPSPSYQATSSRTSTTLTLDGYEDGELVVPVINLWDNYQTRAKVVGKGQHGEKVRLVRRSGNGVLIRLADGTQGWVTYWFIKEYKDTATATAKAVRTVNRTVKRTVAPTASREAAATRPQFDMLAATPTPGTAFVDKVVRYTPGTGAVPKYKDPDAMLGEPDLVESPCCTGMVQLGQEGSILVAFTDNAIVDGSGPDFEVFGESARDDYLLIEVSENGEMWHAFEVVDESPGGLDLADVGLETASFVRITDVQPATATGAELDAIVALHSGSAPAGIRRYVEAIETLNDKPEPTATGSETIPSQDPISIRSMTGYLDYTGDYYLAGEVINNGTQNVEQVEILGNFYDADGQLIKTDSIRAMLDVIEPGATSPFEFFFFATVDGSVYEGIDSYKADITDFVFTDVSPLTLEIVRHEGSGSAAADRHEIRGEIRNPHEFSVEFPMVYATYYDEDGIVIGAPSGSVDLLDLEPGQSSTFNIVFFDPPRDIDHYVLVTEADRK